MSQSHPEFPNLPNLVEIRLDPALHIASPEGVIDGMSWAAMDTAWNLLRDTAVRVAIQVIRESSAEAGLPFPTTDQELFDQVEQAGIPGAPKSHRELAPWNEKAMTAFALVYQNLLKQAIEEASDGLRQELM